MYHIQGVTSFTLIESGTSKQTQVLVVNSRINGKNSSSFFLTLASKSKTNQAD